MRRLLGKSELLRPYFSSLLNSYAEIFFIESRVVGAILLLATFINPNVALAGLLAVLCTLLFAALIRMEPDFIESGFYIYNPLLVGMSIGFLFKITLMSVFLIAVAALLTLLITIVLHTIFSNYLVPILSLPFAIVSSIVYLSSLNYSNLFVEALYDHSFLLSVTAGLPLWIEAYFKSLGTILFMPNVVAGTLFFTILLLHSRIASLMAAAGFYFGSFVHSLLGGSFMASLMDPYAFNYILVAVALGSIFLVPGLRSYFLALFGVAISVLLVDATAIFWTLYKIPVFTLPFNLTVISFLFVLRTVRFMEFAYIVKKRPENTLYYYLQNLFRFRSNEVSLSLPFSGEWGVYQAFDDIWTHRGEWKYAYDFVIYDENGKSYRGDGTKPEDYYAFKKPVLSPVSGYVVAAMDSLPDNKIGEIDNINNWGNYIILSTQAGLYVEISHFAQNSLKVKKGDYIEVGQIVGLCGNSGYSPEPHIHIQVQESPYLGAKTLPFNFFAYIQESKIYFHRRPKKGSKISSFIADKSLDRRLSFVLESRCEYEVLKDGEAVCKLSLRVGMDRFSGKFYFEDQRGNRLFFAKEYGVFYFYDYIGSDSSYLKKIFVALPRVALVGDREVEWEDYLTPRVLFEGFKSSLLMFLASIYSKPFIYEGVWKKDADIIKGLIEIDGKKIVTKAEISKVHGFESFKVNDIEIRRV